MPTKASKTKTATPRERREFTAKVKCEAVLSLWAERRSPSEVCKELQISWQQLQNWQHRAMEAMLDALEPRTSSAERAPALSTRVGKLLEQTERKVSRKSSMEKRLDKLQKLSEAKPDTPATHP